MSGGAGMTITVLIPTYCRYHYLRNVLHDLVAQTRQADEVLVVDQSPESERDEGVYQDFGRALPLKILYLTVTRGTCVSRNLALGHITNDRVLFFDDDLRFESDLLSQFEQIASTGCQAIHGGVRFRSHALQKARPASDDPVYHLIASPNIDQVSGTIGVASGNSLIERRLLAEVNGFDCQFDNGMCDDWDFGLRLFYAGARAIYHPGPSVRHLKAPTGGRRDYYVTGWRRLLGSWRELSPSWRAPLFYFYGKHFTRTATRHLCFLRLLDVFELRYRLFRYPWGVAFGVYWWFASIVRARRMLRVGPLTIGRYEQPPCEVWTSPAWEERSRRADIRDTLIAQK